MAIVRQGLLTEGWMTVDADDFAMQDSTAVAAVTFPADDRPTTLGTAYFDYLALAFHVFPLSRVPARRMILAESAAPVVVREQSCPNFARLNGRMRQEGSLLTSTLYLNE